MRYGMDHEEFTAATGIRDNDSVELEVPGENVTRAVLAFEWTGGAGFDTINAYYDSDKPGYSDGSRYTYRRKQYKRSLYGLHDETSGPVAFNGLRSPSLNGVVIRTQDKSYSQQTVDLAFKQVELDQVKSELAGLPARRSALEARRIELESSL